MKEKLYEIIMLILLILTIFILPTERILNVIIINFTHISNLYFCFLVKIAILLFIIYIYSLHITNSLSYGKLYEFRTQKFERNPIKYIIIAVFTIELIISLFFRILDLTGKINISANTWISYICSLMAITLSALGIIITLSKYFKDKEEKESPKLLILPTQNIDDSKVQYHCELDSNLEGGDKKIIYITLINKGNSSIFTPTFRDSFYFLNSIVYKQSPYRIFDQLHPYIQSKKNKYIIALEIHYEEGMSDTIYKEYEIIYNSDNYNEYMTKFTIEFNRYDGKDVRISYEKQLKNYNRILGVG